MSPSRMFTNFIYVYVDSSVCVFVCIYDCQCRCAYVYLCVHLFSYRVCVHVSVLFCLVSLFNGISTFRGNLMPKPSF